MKSLIAAMMVFAATAAQAETLRWDDEDCGATVMTTDNRSFTWVRPWMAGGHADPAVDTQCTALAVPLEIAEGKAQMLVCKNGTTPVLAIKPDGNIVWDHVEMWLPGKGPSYDCTCTGDDCGDM